MPLKKCPKCSKGVGPRSKECPKCGHLFSSVQKSPKPQTKKSTAKPTNLVIGDGTWVEDIERGMPKPVYPEPLNQKLSAEDVKTNVEYHGLGFCLYNYIDEAAIKDKKLAKMWGETRKKMIEIVEYLYESNSII